MRLQIILYDYIKYALKFVSNVHAIICWKDS